MKAPNQKVWRDTGLVLFVLLAFQGVMLAVGDPLPWANLAVVGAVLVGVRLLLARRQPNTRAQT